ncbi:EAL domain-containing protein [Massilia sp. LXY-6]|uniref:bifunctional diguanylate cyclase/phosphodiesterase n=1 Tax=Massilia sp. LXY-6 TaxID=3379823 RepID=UPI003EE16901
MSNWLARIGRVRLRPPDVAAVLALLGGVAISFALASGLLEAERERARSRFLQRAETHSAAVVNSFGDALVVLQASNALFRSVGQVGPEQFGAFVRPLLKNRPYIEDVVFHRVVEAGGRAAYEAEQKRLRPGFRIIERAGTGVAAAGARRRYLVAEYIEPSDAYEDVSGYDALSFAPQARAFERALDSGAAVASVLMPLLRKHGEQAHMGVVLSMPVYRGGGVPASVAARRADVLGDTSVGVDVGELVGRTLAGANLLDRSGMAIELKGMGEQGMRTAFRWDRLDRRAMPAWHDWLGEEVFTANHSFDLAGQHWELRLSGRSTEMIGGTAPLAILIMGCLLSAGLAAWVRGRFQRAGRIEALVERRTADLEQVLGQMRLYLRAIEASANAVILVDARRPGLPIEYVNPAFERMRGFSAAEVVGQRLAELAEQEPDQAAVAELRQAIREGREGHASMRLFCKDGRELYAEVYIAPVLDDSGEPGHYVITQYDVSTAKRYEAELEVRARYDTLTGLANRALLEDRIDTAIELAGSDAMVWVATLDLDHFKYVNDTLGHGAGDEMLKAVAARMQRAVGRADTVARTGGDEFVLVLPGRAAESEAAATVQAVLDALSEPLRLHGQELVMTGSAGLAAWPADGHDAATLVQHAEVAMYRAKDLGRNAVQFYTPAMNARARERMALEGALRSALHHGEFELYYQPQVDLESGSVVGLEALIRWRHPILGMVRPDRFINLAEETGLIVPIGAWVLRTACRQNCEWQHAGYGPLRIAVNLSARQFAQPGLVPEIAHVLEETGLAPTCLEIELTESLVMEDVEGAIRTMGELKRMGVKLSIDDFGTGYSSLSYLSRFPVDVLKIDRSFVRDITSSADDAAMVTAIIQLARGLHLRVIAEGVETEAQLDYLKQRGCDEVQGHVYARAASGADVEAMLRTGRRVQPQDATA